MKKTGRIIIDGQDWLDFVLRNEYIVKTREEIINLGVETTPKIAAISAIISRHVGEAPEEILRPNKDLLRQGAESHIYLWIRNLRNTIELENGKEVTVAQYNKPPATKDDYDAEPDNGSAATFASEADALSDNGDEPDRRYAEAGSDRFGNNAITYLNKPIMGHIVKRLTEVAVCFGIEDARREADALIGRIDTFVESLG